MFFRKKKSKETTEEIKEASENGWGDGGLFETASEDVPDGAVPEGEAETEAPKKKKTWRQRRAEEKERLAMEKLAEEERQRARRNLTRVSPDPLMGLDGQQLAERQKAGAYNTPVDDETVTLKSIIIGNVCTYFNLIFLIIAICLIAVGSLRDLTFLPIIIANTGIGIIQEWRAKQLLDKMNMINAPRSLVIREGNAEQIPSEELVLDDIVIFEAGNQIPADAVVAEGEVQVNESLLTGEADEIVKKPGDMLMSGSFIVSGSCHARLDRVGPDSYISKLTLEAKAQKKGEQSEMIRSLSRLTKIVGFIIIPISAFLFYQQHTISGLSVKDSVTATVAAVIGMIPEGLYLLASVAMAVSAMRLAMNKVLVHNMKSIETLARVDVLCVDKTGTITENTMKVYSAIPLPSKDDHSMETERTYREEEEMSASEHMTAQAYADLELKLGDFVYAMKNDNITMQAMKEHFTKKSGRRADQVFGFSSVYKYSGAVFGEKAYVLGAPEFLLGSQFETYRPQIAEHASKGYRVLVFGEYPGTLDGGALTEEVLPLGLVLLMNPLREEAKETFRYFAKEGVAVKVISGDSPMTVSEIAGKAGIEGAERFVDASALTDEELRAAADEYTVFGRVSPQQKRLLVSALKDAGHTVAMTGDGVNDVLALKDADCSVAMASGSDAAAHAAQMVLLESDFSKMPAVVSEGRRVVNNIERTASLFLVKNIFSLCMAVFAILLKINYPLEPSQISLISMFTIGIPAFFLSLERNRKRITGRFLSNVFYRALPAGLTDFLIISALMLVCSEFGVKEADLPTLATVLLAIVGLMILWRILKPMTKFHLLLWVAMLAGLIFCGVFLNRIFAISMISKRALIFLAMFALIAETTLRYLSLAIQAIVRFGRWIRRKVTELKERYQNAFMRIG